MEHSTFFRGAARTSYTHNPFMHLYSLFTPQSFLVARRKYIFDTKKTAPKKKKVAVRT
jgi:hypothetical protein